MAFEAGLRHVEHRKQKAAEALFVKPPRPEEMSVVHSLYLQSKHVQSINEYALRRVSPVSEGRADLVIDSDILGSDKLSRGVYLWMHQTVFRNSQFMHLQVTDLLCYTV